MLGKEGNERKLLLKACKIWMMDHQIWWRMMMKNQVQEIECTLSSIGV